MRQEIRHDGDDSEEALRFHFFATFDPSFEQVVETLMESAHCHGLVD